MKKIKKVCVGLITGLTMGLLILVVLIVNHHRDLFHKISGKI